MVILHTTFCCLCPKWDSTNTNTLIVCSFLLSLIIILVYMYLRKRLLCKNERKLLEHINDNSVASSKE